MFFTKNIFHHKEIMLKNVLFDDEYELHISVISDQNTPQNFESGNRIIDPPSYINASIFFFSTEFFLFIYFFEVLSLNLFLDMLYFISVSFYL